jgi:YggT family protein
MFILSNLLVALAQMLDIVLTIVYWLILIRALISWVNPDPGNPIVQFLYAVTEPILSPIRRILPAALRFGIDISAIIAFLAIIFLRSFLVRTLLEISSRIRLVT